MQAATCIRWLARAHEAGKQTSSAGCATTHHILPSRCWCIAFEVLMIPTVCNGLLYTECSAASPLLTLLRPCLFETRIIRSPPPKDTSHLLQRLHFPPLSCSRFLVFCFRCTRVVGFLEGHNPLVVGVQQQHPVRTWRVYHYGEDCDMDRDTLSQLTHFATFHHLFVELRTVRSTKRERAELTYQLSVICGVYFF